MLTLIGFHHAGGSAAALMPLRERLAPHVDLHIAELPGRGMRRREPLHTRRSVLVEQLRRELTPLTHEPYALFGHSLGAIVAYELAHALLAHGQRAPRMLFVAAASAPRMRAEVFGNHPQTDEELIAELHELGGTPPEFFESPQLMELVLPVVRADFRLCDGLSADLPLLPCPIHAFAGLHDRVTDEQLRGWQQHTARAFSLRSFEGDHFFVRSHAPALARALREHLQSAGFAGARDA